MPSFLTLSILLLFSSPSILQKGKADDPNACSPDPRFFHDSPSKAEETMDVGLRCEEDTSWFKREKIKIFFLNKDRTNLRYLTSNNCGEVGWDSLPLYERDSDTYYGVHLSSPRFDERFKLNRKTLSLEAFGSKYSCKKMSKSEVIGERKKLQSSVDQENSKNEI